MAQLEGQIAVVTGAGRGIGRAIALRFAQEGADVACISRTADNASAVAGEIRALGRRTWSFALDVSHAEEVEQAGSRILREAGRVDVLVNNAGITRDGLLVRMPATDWDRVMEINLKGAFLFTKALARGFMRRRSGRIINVSSAIALTGNAGQSNYAASKAGLVGLTKSLAKELGSRGVTVNAIAPGFIETDMTADLTEAVRRKVLDSIALPCLGTPEDVAEAALFLAGVGGRYVTGHTLAIDGGLSMY